MFLANSLLAAFTVSPYGIFAFTPSEDAISSKLRVAHLSPSSSSPINTPHAFDVRMMIRRRLVLSAQTEDEHFQKDYTKSHRWKHEPFDFSSMFGWNTFYKNGLDADMDSDGDDQTTSDVESLEYEWHGHISNSVIVDAITPSILTASENYSQQSAISNSQQRLPSVLIIGCGNSALPRIIHDTFINTTTPVQITCLDYSPVCIDMIRSMYGEMCTNMDFVVGDATQLKDVLSDHHLSKIEETESTNNDAFAHCDIIIDKGLLDAILCGEGFDSDVEKLMNGVNDVLTPHAWGMHVLVCFQLSNASRQSLLELGGDNDAGEDADNIDRPEHYSNALTWEFDVPVEGNENGRGTFNLAWRSKPDAVGIEQMTTTWK